jgi:serine/threonine protein kinase
MDQASGPAEIRAGTKIAGQFVVVQVIERDGRPFEYLVEHARARELGQLVLRPLPAEIVQREDFESVREELVRAGGIKHPNLGPRFVVEKSEDLGWYVARENSDWTALQDYFSSGRGFVIEEITFALLSVTAGLQELRQQGLSHDHIQPDTIFVTPSGEVKLSLVDIDCLRKLSPELYAPRPQEYCAPEEREGGLSVPASDMYRLGALAVHFLCGSPPAEGGAAVLSQIERFRKMLPAQLFSLIKETTVKECSSRSENISRAVTLLEQIAPKQYAFRRNSEPAAAARAEEVNSSGVRREPGQRIAAAVLWFVPIWLLGSFAFLFFYGISVHIHNAAVRATGQLMTKEQYQMQLREILDHGLNWLPLVFLAGLAATVFLAQNGELPGTQRYIPKKRSKKQKLLHRAEIPQKIYYFCGWPVFLCFLGTGIPALFGAIAAGASIDAYRQTRSVGLAFVLSLFLGDTALMAFLVFSGFIPH